MHRRRIHFSNFYDDPEAEDVERGPEAARRADLIRSSPVEPLAGPSPTLYPVHTAPRTGHSSGRQQAAAPLHARVARELLVESEPACSNSSSASIEDVINLDDAVPARPATPDGYVSLRRLHESVEEAVRDVRRLDALMRRAVWHALTLPPAAAAAAADGRSRHDQLGRSAHRTRSDPSATALIDTTAVLHERPFLPPDRYPTLPRLRDDPEHLQRNLTRALFAAQRAGLFERQRAWMQRRAGAGRDASSTASAPPSSRSTAASPQTTPASLRRTALQRIASLSSAAAAHASPARLHSTVTATDGAPHAAEERVQSSVSLLVLRVAKDRAVATVFLRVLRLELYRRRSRDDGVELRYCYYLQRRVLHQWSRVAAAQHRRHRALLTAVAAHWQRVVRCQRALRSVMQAWRRGLQVRHDARVALQHARRERYFLLWRRRLTLHRERAALYDVADQFAAVRQPRGTSAELLALLQGRPLAARGGGVVVTAVGRRLLLQRLISRWKQRTERRLAHHLAVWHFTQKLRARVVRRLCAAARRVALQHHRLELNRTVHRYVAADVTAGYGSRGDSSGGDGGAAAHHEALRAALRVCEVVAMPAALRKYKTSAARGLADAAGRRRCFDRWRRRVQARQADRFHLQCVYAHVVGRWLHALVLRRQALQERRRVMHRWAAAALQHRRAAVADDMHQRQLACSVVGRWRDRLHERTAQRATLVHTCLRRWWTRAMLRSAAAVLHEVRRRVVLQHWHRRALTSARVRTNAYVAETIYETAHVLACFRRWRVRAADRRRVRLAWDVLTQLRRERRCRHVFDVWRRRTFGPATPRRAGPAPAEHASPAPSLLLV